MRSFRPFLVLQPLLGADICLVPGKSAYLGETAANIRKLFELGRRQPAILYLDKFDAIVHVREDTSEDSELRRVVNSL